MSAGSISPIVLSGGAFRVGGPADDAFMETAEFSGPRVGSDDCGAIQSMLSGAAEARGFQFASRASSKCGLCESGPVGTAAVVFSGSCWRENEAFAGPEAGLWDREIIGVDIGVVVTPARRSSNLHPCGTQRLVLDCRGSVP